MKIAFIGCVEFSFLTLQHVLSLDQVQVVGVVTRASSAINSDYHSLEPLAKDYGIPCFLATGNDQENMAEWLKRLNPDVIYCFGWSYLLRRNILEIPPLGAIGYHPTMLPQNRGRHPIIWALALGLRETGSSFFYMDEQADSGDIISQERVEIAPTDNASTLYDKLSTVALSQITAITSSLATGHAIRKPQDHSQATSWRKRSKQDGRIDWRMSATCIFNLVRALTHPYPGAHCEYLGQESKVWEARVVSGSSTPANAEPGKVIQVLGSQIIVKCGEGMICLSSHDLTPLPKAGSYLW